MMTVAELIAELQRHPPQKRVCVVPANVTIDTEQGPCYLDFTAEHASDADDVRDEGPFVLVRGR
jgi:hypothetical protein